MVTFTIPSELRSLCAKYPKELYDLMMRESAGALTDVIATKLKVPGARIGFTSVLHTWGREMQRHPHVHVIIPAVAFDEKKNKLIYPKKSDQFLVHYQPLAARFRSRMERALREEHRELYRDLTPEQVRALNPLKQWNVHLQAVGRGQTALRYLARYVQRSSFHPSRLLGYDAKGRVLLACTSTKGIKSVLRLPPHEFIRRWLQHVLPKGFARIPHYGFASSAAVKTRLRVRAHRGEIGEPLPQLPELPAFCCEACGGELVFLRELPRLQKVYPRRGPPKPLPSKP